MSDSPYVRDERYTRTPEYDPFDHPVPAYAPGTGGPPYTAPFDPHTAETLGYGETYPQPRTGAPYLAPHASPYAFAPEDVHASGTDTYAPAYESAAASPRRRTGGSPGEGDPPAPAQRGARAYGGDPASDDPYGDPGVPARPVPYEARADGEGRAARRRRARGAGQTDAAPRPRSPAHPQDPEHLRSPEHHHSPTLPYGVGPVRPPRADGPVRRLLPRALVVAFLAGGTTAFVAEDKAVELSVDGRPRTLHTFADDVTELLAQEGVVVGPHDMVAPAPGTELESGDEVAVRYGRPLRLTLDGHRREVWTTAHTVEGALEQLGVRAQGAYVSTSRSRPIGREGLVLDVRTERSVTIMADGRARTIRTNAATVREAVEQAGITLRGQDAISVPQGSFPRDGQTVTVLRITGTKEVREERIPFEVRWTEDPTLFKGTEVVERPGLPGLRRVTLHLRTVNGVRQKPRLVETETVREPRDQLVKVGTKALPASVRGADGLDWQALAVCESGGRPDAVDSSGTYGGLYQFDTRTWQSLGGSGRPQDAPAAEQTFRAKKLYMRRGASPWPHCGARLHG
ncbi:ubiquitin-like domain-containing protein [Streptomyces sp. NPDC006458]|uniref:ubiquitin-like domain-containing protein n=1 Tax=Streptomyces sp. NPDC006458 TaxID=3154302 RepID=UPI0033B1CD06